MNLMFSWYPRAPPASRYVAAIDVRMREPNSVFVADSMGISPMFQSDNHVMISMPRGGMANCVISMLSSLTFFMSGL